mgnify:CR=1 FL=1
MSHRKVFVSAVLLSAVLLGQSKTTASLSGVVEDASSARVPGAKLVLTNADTNARFEATSNSEGFYFVPLITPGTYRAEVTKENFAPWARRGLELTVGQEANLDVRMEVGGAQSSVVMNGCVCERTRKR